MVGLTAHDIHPPLYYGLLHGWLRMLNGQDPVALRSFSVIIGFMAQKRLLRVEIKST